MWLFKDDETNQQNTGNDKVEINIQCIPGFEWIFTDYEHTELICMYCRGAGKTLSSVDWLFSRLIPHKQENAIGMIFTNNLDQARDGVRRALLRYKDLVKLGYIKFNESTGEIQIKSHPKATSIESKVIKLKSYEQDENIRGGRPNFIVLDEAKDMPEALYKTVIAPLFDPRDKSTQMLIVGTPQGEDNLFYKKFKDGQDPNVTYSKSVKKTCYDLNYDNEYLTRQKRDMGEKNFRQEFLCDSSVNISYGNIYKDIIDQLEILDCISDETQYNPKYPVNIAFDLGYNDATAVVFWQTYNDRNFIIDYMEVTHTFFPETIKKVKAKGYFDIKYCILPHDSTNNNVAGDRTVYNQAVGEGWNVIKLPRAKSVLEEIEPCRSFLRTCKFSKTKCILLLNHLSRYKFETKVSRDPAHLGETYCGKKPEEIGDHLHGCDAFRYVAMSSQRLESTATFSQHLRNAQLFNRPTIRL